MAALCPAANGYGIGVGGHGAIGHGVIGGPVVLPGQGGWGGQAGSGWAGWRGHYGCCGGGGGVFIYDPLWDPYLWDYAPYEALVPAAPGYAPPVPAVWYFCRDSGMYYPYVLRCAAPWQVVPASP